MIIDLTRESDEELEDLLLDLCGRLELSDEEVELLYLVEEEGKRRQEGGTRKSQKHSRAA